MDAETPVADPFGFAGPQEAAEIYRETRHNITALVQDLPADRAALAVPTTPGWNVRDLTAHILHVCSRAEQPEDGVTYVPGVPISGVLEQWTETAEEVEARFPEIEPLNRLKMVMDAYTHEQDLRGALDLPQTVVHPAFHIAFSLVALGFSLSLAEYGLPSVAFETPDGRWVSGADPAPVTVRGPSHDLFRALAGRRTLQQITEFDWSQDPQPFLPAFTWGPFRPPTQVVES